MDKKRRWFGRRVGKKLSLRRKALIMTLLPKIKINKDALITCKSVKTFKPFVSRDTWLEIGFGGGEYIAGQAIRHPEINFIGCEPFINGVASLLSKIEENQLKNIFIYDDDAITLLDLLPERSIGRIFCLFSDPWPKKRHQKRRFIGKKNLNRVSRILKDGGEFNFATDHVAYAYWTLEHFQRQKDFERVQETFGDWLDPPQDWISTRYELKARSNGQDPVFLQYKRRFRDS